MVSVNIINFDFGLSAGGVGNVIPAFRQWWWQSRHRSEYVRFSISALVRIQVGSEYLLVRGHRFADRYQPVGGVLKRLPDSAGDIAALKPLPDNMFTEDDENRDDLRLRIHGKHLRRFLKWYASGRGRETGPWREFHEELVAPGILGHRDFPHALFQHVGQHSPGIQPGEHGQGLECRIAEIYSLHPSREQHAALVELKQHKEDERFAWVDDAAIRSRGVSGKEQPLANIAETAQWIL